MNILMIFFGTDTERFCPWYGELLRKRGYADGHLEGCIYWTKWWPRQNSKHHDLWISRPYTPVRESAIHGL